MKGFLRALLRLAAMVLGLLLVAAGLAVAVWGFVKGGGEILILPALLFGIVPGALLLDRLRRGGRAAGRTHAATGARPRS